MASVRPTGLAGSVYNLSVGDEPEYFAEGILVHNCLVYLARNVRWHRDCRPKAPVIPWGNKPAANATGWDGAFNRKSR